MLEILLCLGMSNAEDLCQAWQQDNQTNIIIIECAESGQDINTVHNLPNYWRQVAACVATNGYVPTDVTIVLHKNATQQIRDPFTFDQAHAVVRDYKIEIQAGAQIHYPNAIGYHLPRSDGTWCPANPEPFSGDVINAAAEAAANFNNWNIGPRIDQAAYVQSDFPDGCHMNAAGLAKAVPVVNAFFGAAQPPPNGEIPVVTYVGSGNFSVSVPAQCGSAATQLVNIPNDLAYGAQHSCQANGSSSNLFGCRTASDCKVW